MLVAPEDHVVPLTDGWALWREVCLRSAGFPAATAGFLPSARLCVALEGLFRLEGEVETARKEAIAACQDALRDEGGQTSLVLTLLKQLRKGQIVDADPGTEVTLQVYRDDQRRELMATVAKRPLQSRHPRACTRS